MFLPSVVERPHASVVVVCRSDRSIALLTGGRPHRDDDEDARLLQMTLIRYGAAVRPSRRWARAESSTARAARAPQRHRDAALVRLLFFSPLRARPPSRRQIPAVASPRTRRDRRSCTASAIRRTSRRLRTWDVPRLVRRLWSRTNRGIPAGLTATLSVGVSVVSQLIT